jgi:excinuclease ABC subunit A
MGESKPVGNGYIRVGGAREHNLKNLTLSIPRDRLVVITGLSGSGKSSLAFDTIFAEGQRKYVESLSAYARQFLDQMEKPEVDYIEGLSPAIAIEQRSAGANPRSIIATTTEIYDYLRLLFAHVGSRIVRRVAIRFHGGRPVTLWMACWHYRSALDLMVLAPVVTGQKGEFRDVMERLAREGFVRARVDGTIVELAANVRVQMDPKALHTIEAVVDRLVVDEKIRVRLSDSVETALKWGEGRLVTLCQAPGDDPARWVETRYSNRLYSPSTGRTYEPPTPKHFSFNSPQGACPVCHGLGQKLVIDEGLVVPDPEKSLEQGAIAAWRRGGKRMVVYYKGLLRAVAGHYGQSLETPYRLLPESFRRRCCCVGRGRRRLSFSSRGRARSARCGVRLRG